MIAIVIPPEMFLKKKSYNKTFSPTTHFNMGLTVSFCSLFFVILFVIRFNNKFIRLFLKVVASGELN